jgi:hypothetical protein
MDLVPSEAFIVIVTLIGQLDWIAIPRNSVTPVQGQIL